MAKNINKLLKQAQKMQNQMAKAQEELAQKEVEGTAGGGMVKVTMNGSNEILAVALNKEVVDPEDIEMLEDLIVAACKNAQEQVKQMSDEAFGSMQGGIPGMM